MTSDVSKNSCYCTFCKDMAEKIAAWQVHAASSHLFLMLLVQGTADLSVSSVHGQVQQYPGTHC